MSFNGIDLRVWAQRWRSGLLAPLGFGLLLLGGCAGATQSQLIRRAAFDLNCPGERIDIVRIDGETRGAMGCGRRAAYREVCEGSSCRWVFDGPNPGGDRRLRGDPRDRGW